MSWQCDGGAVAVLWQSYNSYITVIQRSLNGDVTSGEAKRVEPRGRLGRNTARVAWRCAAATRGAAARRLS